MPGRTVLLTALFCMSFSSAEATGQSAPAQGSDRAKNQEQTAPVPKHDISGLWEPAIVRSGVGAGGPRNMPNDGKPEHELPYTSLGLQIYNSHKTLEGPNAVPPGEDNDPRNLCEPLGFPRMNWHYLLSTQIVQTEAKVLILYQYDQRWREIVMNEELPKDLVDSERRFYGYSVGKWLDDTTLLVQTNGTMAADRVWLDATGRPASEQLRVEERFHRVNRDLLELSVTIDDPKMFTKPWVALDAFPMKRLPSNQRVLEMLCSPVEQQKYLDEVKSVRDSEGK